MIKLKEINKKKEDPTICCLEETHLTDETNIGLW
jgi:hypothetical protein